MNSGPSNGVLPKSGIAFSPAGSMVTHDVAFSWGKIFLLLFAVVVIGRIQEVVPALGPAHLGLVTGALAGLMWFLAPGSREDKIPVRIPQVKYVLWLFLLALLTVPVGVWPGHSVEFIAGSYWKTILFYLMVVFWARSVASLRSMIWVCCIGLSALVVLGLAFGFGDAERFQAGSTTYDANDLALVLVIALPLLVYLFSISRPALKFLVSGMIFTSLYGIVLTGSRGGFLALLFVSYLTIFRSKISMATKVGIIVLALVVFGSLAGAQYWERMYTMWSPQTEYDQTAGGRTELWKTGLQILASHPWGVGINGFTIAEGLSHGGSGAWVTAHNSFLQIAVELGLAGLVVFILLIMGAIRDLRKIQGVRKRLLPRGMLPRRAAREEIQPMAPLQAPLLPIANALETSLWGFVVGGFFLSQAYSPVLYCILALSLACKRMMQETTTSMPKAAKGHERG